MLFGKAGRKNERYYGKDTYRHFDKLLSRTGEILIVSPYIDAYYAKILVRKSRGRKIYLISSSPESGALKIIKGESASLVIVAYTALSLLLFLLLLHLGIRNSLLFISLLPFLFGLYKAFTKRSKVRVKLPKQFIHAKMYISKDMAITGSANITYNGMHKNLEQTEIVYNVDEISRLRKQFWRIWNSV